MKKIIKEKQKLRTLSYFIDATIELVEKEGINHLTTRKVAELAGYNQPTLYNYFSSIDHLLGYVGIKYLNEYYLDADKKIIDIKDPFDKYIEAWKLFMAHTLKHPVIWQSMFFLMPKDEVNKIYFEYFEIYPDNHEIHSGAITNMFNASTINQRNEKFIEVVFKESILSEQELQRLCEMTIFLYRGMLGRIVLLKDQSDFSSELLNFENYLRQIVYSFKKK